ncbi:MAG: RecQ family ATP-dependent DNA helicase [Elusimicrobia bacterium]|nr:RecQ family ATP-dependent DNA helicase [Elusimicrobiota bacterium]
MREQALAYLRQAIAQRDAQFRERQWECIEALLQRRRLLVVQRTGWGKSMVYFVATKLMREQGMGPTLLISPLLALMRNQIAAARNLGIRAETINSSNRDDWDQIEGLLHANQVDILLISPERLANDEFRANVLQHIASRVGFLVVDEAHCISDWGHDFRPDYRRIVRIMQALPNNLPVLATTATANDRVVQDVAVQLGNLHVVRGPLIRESLMLQNIWLPSPAARMAWLVENLPRMKGSGIIYTLTIRDAERVAQWLRLNRLAAEAYHADIGQNADGTSRREELEQKLLNNEVKALVSTVALGMGFDKPDLGFVVHFQRPGSVVHYYQQVGRAGRAVDQAYGILLSGEEDAEITDYFIRTAFPPQAHVSLILRALDAAPNGLSVRELESQVNLRRSQIQKALRLLSTEDPSPIIKQGSKWSATAVVYQVDQQAIDRLSKVRRAEQQDMLAYMRSGDCLMRFLARKLDDPFAQPCGKCANCAGRELLPKTADPELTNQAAIFLRRSYQPLQPRRQWPSGNAFPFYGFHGRIDDDLQAAEGRALCIWGDAGWGELVRAGKYHDGRFPDVLVQGCLEMLKTWAPVPQPRWVTCVPSLRHPNLVPDFAQRLAARLGVPFSPCVRKISDNPPQKNMENSFQQARNLDGAFEIDQHLLQKEPALLLDDMTDSGWTFAVAAALLRRSGCPCVHPLALALTWSRLE